MTFAKLRWMRTAVHRRFVILAVIFLVVGAIFLTFFLQYRYFINDAEAAFEFVWDRPLVFWYSVSLMFLVLVFLTGLTRRPVLAVGIVWAFLIGLTYVHISKYIARGAPLLPEDFALASQASSMVKFIDVGTLLRTIFAAVLALLLAGVASWQVSRRFGLPERRRLEKQWWRRWAVVSRVVLMVFSVVMLLGLTDFVRHHRNERYEDITWLDTQLVGWNQVRNYDENGFILGFLYNTHKFEMKEPEGYSGEKIAEILAKYRAALVRGDAERKSLGEEDINVVIILNESFFDPTVSANGYNFRDFYPYEGGEILPTWRSVQAEYPSGYMYSTDYGGGTANVELEVLTGLTNYWANTVPYTELVPRAGDVVSVASYLRGQGYKTTAIHPFNGAMYKRNIAMNHFGFETFITELEMNYREHEGRSEYINDRSAYLQVLDVLDGSEQNQLISLVSMQNHLPYNHDIYEQTDFKISDMSLDEGRRRELEIYYQMLHNSDRYLGEFLAELEKLDKKVAVLFFGDHAGGVFSRVNDNTDKGVSDLARMTPYFVYTNFAAEGVGPRDLPVNTPNCLSNTFFNVLMADKPELFYLLDVVCEQMPILTRAWFGAQAPVMSEALREYELVTYDLLSGRKNWMR